MWIHLHYAVDPEFPRGEPIICHNCYRKLKTSAFQYYVYWSLQWPPLDVSTGGVGQTPSLWTDRRLWKHYLVLRSVKNGPPLVWLLKGELEWGRYVRSIAICRNKLNLARAALTNCATHAHDWDILILIPLFSVLAKRLGHFDYLTLSYICVNFPWNVIEGGRGY